MSVVSVDVSNTETMVSVDVSNTETVVSVDVSNTETCLWFLWTLKQH